MWDGHMELNASEHLRGMAFHEAGHAVVAWALGLPVGDIYVRQIEEGNGDAQIGCADALSFIDRLAVCFAGIRAEEVFDVPQPRGMGDADNLMVIRLLEAYRNGKASRFAIEAERVPASF